MADNSWLNEDTPSLSIPLEIFREILIWRATSASPAERLDMMLLCKLACKWIEPLLYRRIIIRFDKWLGNEDVQNANYKLVASFQLRLDGIFASKTPAFLAQNVQVLFLPSWDLWPVGTPFPYPTVKLPRLRHLRCALPHTSEDCRSFLDLVLAAPLQTLAVYISQGSPAFSGPLPDHFSDLIGSSTLTHLSLSLSPQSNTADRLVQLFPKLTHLCLYLELTTFLPALNRMLEFLETCSEHGDHRIHVILVPIRDKDEACLSQSEVVRKPNVALLAAALNIASSHPTAQEFDAWVDGEPSVWTIGDAILESKRFENESSHAE
ncbi:hypothetical protein DL96DRAFT_1585324 [Flagelloscypha sp. PMI_526]|nr:hypothetical protein DL96DRAFT_1585324 [Flagelloscypha sp. PMI_526]